MKNNAARNEPRSGDIISPGSMGIIDGKTCRSGQEGERRLIEQTDRLWLRGSVPDGGENSAGPQERCLVGEKEQPAAGFQFGTGLDERFYSGGTRGYGQHSEAM